MTELLFWTFAGVAIGGGIGVVAGRSPIASLLFMVATLASVSGIYILFEAHFLAAIQVIVYAGAIMVLFLFVIMLLMSMRIFWAMKLDGQFMTAVV